LELLKTIDVDIVTTEVNWHYYKVSGIALIKGMLSHKPDIKIIGLHLRIRRKLPRNATVRCNKYIYKCWKY